MFFICNKELIPKYQYIKIIIKKFCIIVLLQFLHNMKYKLISNKKLIKVVTSSNVYSIYSINNICFVLRLHIDAFIYIKLNAKLTAFHYGSTIEEANYYLHRIWHSIRMDSCGVRVASISYQVKANCADRANPVVFLATQCGAKLL